MLDIPTAENIKNSKLALIAGLLIGLSLGAGGTWTASTTIHEAQLKVLDAVNKDLQRQVVELETSSQVNEAEMARLALPQRAEERAERLTGHTATWSAYLRTGVNEVLAWFAPFRD
jgi:hypothetical protein